MRSTFSQVVHNKFAVSAFLLVLLVAVGTGGYWIISGGRASLVDCLYMTVITLTTIGYGEIVDLSASPGGRVFTMFIALSGIGTLSYIITNFTASIVEGDLSESFRRKRMEKLAGKLDGHYIVCGFGRIGRQIVHELVTTRRDFAVVESDKAALRDLPAALRDRVVIEGDATDSAVLQLAGVERAKGVFCVADDDNVNLVIGLTARQLNGTVRIVSRCNDLGRRDKMQFSGADAVVSPTFIGGLRLVSEMVRPTVVSFLDIMLRDKDKNLRVEEVPVPAQLGGRTVASLKLRRFPAVLLLAVRKGEGWVYNPPEEHALAAGDRLIVMTSPEERQRLEQDLHAAT